MDERVEDIEVKLAYLEKRMHDLDAVVCDLADTITALRSEVKELRDTPVAEAPLTGDARLKDEVPPHH